MLWGISFMSVRKKSESGVRAQTLWSVSRKSAQTLMSESRVRAQTLWSVS